jgi:transcriptional regulator with XRE-family HTH domain
MDDNSTPWPEELTTRLGELVAAARNARGMSAVKLAEATDQIGVPIHRVAITRIEKGEQVVTVLELIALGAALDADWTGWLIKAAEGLPITSEPDQRADLRIVLADVNEQLATLQRNLFQAVEGPQRLNMPDALRQKMAQDAERYQDMIFELQKNKEMILRLLNETRDA